MWRQVSSSALRENYPQPTIRQNLPVKQKEVCEVEANKELAQEARCLRDGLADWRLGHCRGHMPTPEAPRSCRGGLCEGGRQSGGRGLGVGWEMGITMPEGFLPAPRYPPQHRQLQCQLQGRCQGRVAGAAGFGRRSRADGFGVESNGAKWLNLKHDQATCAHERARIPSQ